MVVPKIITDAASVVLQNKIDRVRFLGRGARLKRKRHSLPVSFSAPPPCSLHVWRGGQGQRRVIVLKDLSHTFEKNHQRLLLGNYNVPASQGKSWNW